MMQPDSMNIPNTSWVIVKFQAQIDWCDLAARCVSKGNHEKFLEAECWVWWF